MISFNRIVRISLHDMACRRQQLIEHTRIGRRAIGVHLCGAGAVVEGAGKESTRGRQISFVGYQDIDDLAILVDCADGLGGFQRVVLSEFPWEWARKRHEPRSRDSRLPACRKTWVASGYPVASASVPESGPGAGVHVEHMAGPATVVSVAECWRTWWHRGWAPCFDLVASRYPAAFTVCYPRPGHIGYRSRWDARG